MKNILITIVLLTLFLAACEKNITIPQPPYESRVSIQGTMEPGTVPSVFIYKTIPYFAEANLSQLFAKDASVKIAGPETSEYLTIDSSYNYIKCEYEYFFKGKILAETNKKYQLTIIFNNITYTASTTTNISAVKIDSIGYTNVFKDIYGEHEGVVPYFHDVAGQVNYFRYEMTRMIDTTMKYREGKIHSPCIGGGSVTILEEGRSVYNDINLDGGQINLVIEPAYSHRKDLITTVRIQSIDKYTYDFYDQLDRQKRGQLNPFVEPVFLTDGQFGKKAIGYFGSIVRSAPVQFIFPE